MRLSRFLFSAATIVAGSSAAARDVYQAKPISVDSVTPDSQRFLRTTKSVEGHDDGKGDDVVSNVKTKNDGNEQLVKTTSFNTPHIEPRNGGQTAWRN
ncbi:RxLR effector protein [Phytophthora megakarya]|uniref:RxLR effector protein n=1 Tax=Phytophthora megakarya TaxID=4795 RepID=A0A225WRW2_9STRA|nr:RxLR effector protein [Phytophthora megakarya]